MEVMWLDDDVQRHIECHDCGTVGYVSYNEMVEQGWRVMYYQGFICPKCAAASESIREKTVSIEEAHNNRSY